jgi:hypothetical protein
MDLVLTGTDALATDIVAAQVMKLDWRSTYLGYVAAKTGLHEADIAVEGVPITEVSRRFLLPRIDLPVKAQMEIYKHEYLTKLMFCSLPVVKMFQKVTTAYRGAPVEPA